MLTLPRVSCEVKNSQWCRLNRNFINSIFPTLDSAGNGKGKSKGGKGKGKGNAKGKDKGNGKDKGKDKFKG